MERREVRWGEGGDKRGKAGMNKEEGGGGGRGFIPICVMNKSQWRSVC